MRLMRNYNNLMDTFLRTFCQMSYKARQKRNEIISKWFIKVRWSSNFTIACYNLSLTTVEKDLKWPNGYCNTNNININTG